MIREWNGHKPQIDPTAYVHETAEVIGKVVIKKNASIWPNAVLRGDIEEIVIGEETNIQVNTVIHTDHRLFSVRGFLSDIRSFCTAVP